MLLDLSKYKKKIIEKLENKDLNFNEVEIMMLNIDSDIRKKFFDALKADLSLFTVDVLKVVKKINDYDEVLLDDLNLLLAYGKAEITVGDDYSIVYALRDYVEEEAVKEVENYFLELIDTNQLKPNADSSSEVIEFVLDNKRFSFFDYVGKCGKFSATAINKIKEYADTVERVPDFFAEEQESLNLDYSKYSAAALLKIFGQKVYGKDNNYLNVVNKGEDEDIDKIYRLICDKLSIGESFDIKLFQKNLIPQFINFDQNNKRNLLTKIIEVIGIDESLINSLRDDFSSYEDLLLNSISPQTEIKAISNVFSDIFRSTKILEKLIECGLLEFATNFQRFADYTSVVINKIESGDPLYQNISINHNYAIQRDLNLLSILLEKNMITNLSFSANELISSSSLKKIVLEAVRRGQTIRFDENCYELDGVLDTIIQSRNFETLRQTNLNQLDNAILKEESINILIEELKQNVVLVDKILLSANSLIFQNKSLLNFYLQSDKYFIEKVIDRINHDENLNYLYNVEVYELVKGYYSEKHNLNLKNLDIICHKFGPNVIRYLDNDSIHKLVNLNETEFTKFIALFNDERMKLSDLSNIYDSLIQYKFSKEHNEVVNIFAEIMHSLDDKNGIYIKKLEELYSVLSDKFYDKFAVAYPNFVDEFKTNPKQYLLNIVYQIQNNVEMKDECTEILHFVANYYIATRREEYRDKCNMYEDNNLSIPYDLDENSLEKKLIEICLNNLSHSKVIINKMVEMGINEELARKCVMYYLSKKDKTSDVQDIEVRILNDSKISFSLDEIKKIKPHLRELSLISKEYVKIMPEREYYIKYLDQENLVERVYKMPSSTPDLFQILSRINVSALKHTLANEDAYSSLLQTMHKYKIHFIPDELKNLLESKHIEISGDYGNLSGFISYYDKIYEAEKSRLESQGKSTSNISLKPVSIFIYSEVYSSVSSVYSQVLSSTDASLIKANPGPNQATKKTTGNDRLNEAVERTIANFKRMKVTVPTFASNVTLDSGKTMHAVVGNFTNPVNMTHGERTGACMRIGGVGESLFQFCLDNENGFHIRFEHPTTGEYISRVSGFRNGNTVFLNELRNSCNSEAYDDDEIVEACRIVAQMLIDKSKSSECPIDNVVVHTAYAVNNSKYHKTDLGVSNIKDGLPSFYSDVSASAHILATSSETALFVPLDFDKSKVPTYLPARDKAKESSNLKELIDMINRVSGVKALLAGESLENIEPVITNDSFIYGLASNDWYIYIDNNFEVHDDIIHIDERAKEELAIARKRIEELLPAIEKEHAYSY